MIVQNTFPIKFRNPREIIAEHRLIRLGFKYVLANNKAQMVPYHNTWHLMCMLKYVDWLVRSERHAGVYEQDDPLDEIALLLAALFHDVNHSAGKSADDVNVANSKFAFSEFLSIVDDYDIREEWLRSRVHRLIDATQYPYVIPVSELTHDQKIMRDADLMQAYEDNMFYHVILGLCAENDRPILPDIKRNVIFHKDAVALTSSGKMLREAALPILIAEHEGYIRILE